MIRAIIYSVLFALCLVSGPAGAAPAAKSEHHPASDSAPAWSHWEQRVRRMDLEPAQKEKVAKILDESRKEREGLQALVRQASTELNDLIQQPNAKEQAILKQADKLGELRTEGQKARLRALLKVRAELTPEQRQQLTAKAPAGSANAPRQPAAPTPANPTPPAATPVAP